MNEDLNEFIRNTSDKYLYEMLLAIFYRMFSEDSILYALLTLSHKHGMPIKNIMSFIEELGDWCKNHDRNDAPLSPQELSDLNTLFRNSGIRTDFPGTGGDE